VSAQLKIVILLRESKASVGVQSPGCDPQISIMEGTLEQVLERVPGLAKQAQEKWAQSPQNPRTEIVTAPPSPTPSRTPSPASSTSKSAQNKDQPAFF
jgi:hypothetical protein